eukprot:3989673-Heterocapsa_arctica.AAC.1
MGGQKEHTQDGIQKQEEIVTQDYKDHHIMEEEKEVRNAKKTNKRGSADNEDLQYPGVSSQKRVKLRAEQLFVEAQVLKKAKQADAEQKRVRKHKKEGTDHENHTK